MVTLNSPLISVIVPVYNAENSIIRCVESVLAQREARVELILVDDGSTDSSPLILESWRDHPQVRIITQRNAGVSSARNAGIAASRGVYLRFVDADDFLPDNALSLCLSLMNNDVGLIVGESQHFTPQGRPVARTFPSAARRVLSASDAVNDLLYFHPRHGICDKLFNGELIRAHQLRFNEQIANFEDLLFVMQYLSLLKSQRVICINSVIYNYVESENSATRSSVREKHFSFARSFSEMQRLLSRSNDKFFYFLLLKVSSAYLYKAIVSGEFNSAFINDHIRRYRQAFKAYLSSGVIVNGWSLYFTLFFCSPRLVSQLRKLAQSAVRGG
ncbi:MULTISPECIES: glycosyltransferase [Pantoea]|jgi:glycosyltransferase involved in cell wall biosynthesis|uniref:glycosyltransferase n=1 Tax=Pantoea TaxID=53335 RepID=UPI000EA3C06A|nr:MULTISPECIES: glycosyltransferase [Pantoea]MBZ6388548.1 glycosyltransferase [Pantoea piersonii]MBZ6402278.1 glycosyltransferase [Pantoea piersonii]MBZ6410529.1 glycosyltransferase [Pantoea piersonii]MBZ6427407.1 glycosyltransferase [Pantoea piersonii]NYB02317.1 glycosyltransferase [Pantoea piersonii]